MIVVNNKKSVENHEVNEPPKSFFYLSVVIGILLRSTACYNGVKHLVSTCMGEGISMSISVDSPSDETLN